MQVKNRTVVNSGVALRTGLRASVLVAVVVLGSSQLAWAKNLGKKYAEPGQGVVVVEVSNGDTFSEFVVEEGGVMEIVEKGNGGRGSLRRNLNATGKIKNSGLIIFTGNQDIDLDSDDIEIENDGFLVVASKHESRMKPEKRAKLANGVDSTIWGTGLINADIVNKGTIVVGLDACTVNNVLGRLDQTQDKATIDRIKAAINHNKRKVGAHAQAAKSALSNKSGGARVRSIPSGSLFTINGYLSMSSGELVINLSWDTATSQPIYGQMDVADGVTLGGGKLTVNADGAYASHVQFAHHFDVIKTSGGITGEFGTWVGTGLSGTGKRYGHRLDTAGAIDKYWVDLVTFTSSAAPGAFITVRGDFPTAAPAVNEFWFMKAGEQYPTKLPAINPPQAPARLAAPNTATGISVKVPTGIAATGPLMWKNMNSGAGAGNTITFNNFTSP